MTVIRPNRTVWCIRTILLVYNIIMYYVLKIVMWSSHISSCECEVMYLTTAVAKFNVRWNRQLSMEAHNYWRGVDNIYIYMYIVNILITNSILQSRPNRFCCSVHHFWGDYQKNLKSNIIKKTNFYRYITYKEPYCINIIFKIIYKV